MKIGSWEVWKNTRKMAILVFLDLESELCLGQKYFLLWKWKRKKLSKSEICNTVGSIQESNRVIDKNRENRFFQFFPFIFDWDLFTSRKRLHPVHYSLLKSRSVAAPMGIRSRAIARVMVPSAYYNMYLI